MKRKVITIVVMMLLITIAIPQFTAEQKKHPHLLNSNDNTPPNPPLINGPTSGKIRQSHAYDFTLTDPDLDDFLTTLEIDFGEDESEILTFHCADTPWYNGTVLTVDHYWFNEGTYHITARVLDSYGAWSNWSEPLIVTMPKSRNQFIDLMQHLLENHPIINMILRLLT
jgi:hypothetical protein